MSTAFWLLGAYVLGATPTSYIAGRLGRGIDLREHGSKNLGATNVYRLLGWKFAIPVGVIDVAKGALPVALSASWAGGLAWLPLAVGVAAVVGHMFSPYVRFRGGKGVATAAGVFLALAPLPLLAAVPVWGVSLWITGYVSLSSIIAVASFPVWVRVFEPAQLYTFWASVALAVLIVFAHRGNIRRLVAGTESRFGAHRGAAA